MEEPMKESEEYTTLDTVLNVPHNLASLGWSASVAPVCEEYDGEVKIKRLYPADDLHHPVKSSYPEIYDCKNALDILQMLGEAATRRPYGKPYGKRAESDSIEPRIRIMVEGRGREASGLAVLLFEKTKFDEIEYIYLVDDEGKFHKRSKLSAD